MFDTAHISVGLAIGRKIPNPIIAFFVGVASHFLMDAIPHWDTGGRPIFQNKKLTRDGLILISADMLASFVLLMVAWRIGWIGPNSAYISVFAGALGAILPDLLLPPYYILGWFKYIFKFHERLQNITNFLPGILGQMILVAAAYWFGR